ncbi:MAG: ATPase, T2SS/T4P/T4SS family, partial [Planctomycetota bacterium]|nr:ATPase, T2SS/T4P/T4SS family [Planctomycetota bacterium]
RIHIDRLLETAIRRNASDLYLTVGRPPVLRVNLQLRQLETVELEPEDLDSLMKSITPDRCQEELKERGATVFAFAFGDAGCFRASVRRQLGGIDIALRHVKVLPLTFEQAGLPPIMKALCRRTRGLVLVAGSACSGKTALLVSMIEFINQEMSRRISILEDPIEYYHCHKKSLITKYDLSELPTTYPDAIRCSVREGSDVIVVGRFEDAETIEAAFDAAAAGVLVFAHMPSGKGVAKALDQLVDRFPPARQDAIWRRLADSLICAIYQALCPGFKHVVPALEFMVVNPAMSEIIREAQTCKIDEAIQAGRKYGMRLLDDELYRLFESGKIAADALLFMARRPGDLQERLEKKDGRNDESDGDPLGNRVPAPPRGPAPGLDGHADAKDN